MLSNHLPVVFLLLSSSVVAAPNVLIDYEAWEGFSAPEIIGSGFTHNLFALPLEGSVELKGPKHWSSDYWPSQKGGINLRWNSASKKGFDYRSPSLPELRQMSAKNLSELAPSEKFDILTGRYNYPLKKEVAATVSPKADEWEGICHGWVVATTFHNEPTPKNLRNADGIEVPFGSADIKALISYFYAIDQGPADNMGHRCDLAKWTGGAKECDQDLNAGAFHILIANKIALKGEGLIMDVDRLKEVWNQPIVSYKSKILGSGSPSRGAARSAVTEYKISTELFYVDETDESTWAIVHGTDNQKISKKDLIYTIELNAQNEIVGGNWISDVRPDFIWQKAKAKTFGGMFAMLPELLNDTAGATRATAPRDYRDSYNTGRPDPRNGPVYDPRRDPRNDPRYDPRRDPRNDPRYDPRYDPRRDPRDDRYRDPYYRGSEDADRDFDRHYDDDYREDNDRNGNGIPDERLPERPRHRRDDRYEDEDEDEDDYENEYEENRR